MSIDVDPLFNKLQMTSVLLWQTSIDATLLKHTSIDIKPLYNKCQLTLVPSVQMSTRFKNIKETVWDHLDEISLLFLLFLVCTKGLLAVKLRLQPMELHLHPISLHLNIVVVVWAQVFILSYWISQRLFFLLLLPHF